MPKPQTMHNFLPSYISCFSCFFFIITIHFKLICLNHKLCITSYHLIFHFFLISLLSMLYARYLVFPKKMTTCYFLPSYISFFSYFFIIHVVRKIFSVSKKDDHFLLNKTYLHLYLKFQQNQTFFVINISIYFLMDVGLKALSFGAL
jgi:hypothetical protein